VDTYKQTKKDEIMAMQDSPIRKVNQSCKLAIEPTTKLELPPLTDNTERMMTELAIKACCW
jgi:hypothetical protein